MYFFKLVWYSIENAKSWPIMAYILQVQILRCTKIYKHVVWRPPFGFGIILFFVNCAYCKERKITKLSSLLSVPTTGHSWRPVISCRWGYKLIFQWNDVSCSDIAWREIRKMRTPIITTFFILQSCYWWSWWRWLLIKQI